MLAQVRDGVGVITLNRAERRNALHPEMLDAVPALVQRFSTDPEVGCILLTAAGTAFCAGGDVRDGIDRRRQAGSRLADGAVPDVEAAARALAHDARMVLALHESPTISLAALPGPAVGAGIGIALAADLRIAATSARLVPGWARLGFSGDFGGAWLLTRLIGPARTLELLVDGEGLDAATALGLGVFNRVVPGEELGEAAFEWARRIASGPRAAHASMKQNVAEPSVLSLREALPLEADRMARSGQTEDHRAAVRAWLEAATAKAEG